MTIVLPINHNTKMIRLKAACESHQEIRTVLAHAQKTEVRYPFVVSAIIHVHVVSSLQPCCSSVHQIDLGPETNRWESPPLPTASSTPCYTQSPHACQPLAQAADGCASVRYSCGNHTRELVGCSGAKAFLTQDAPCQAKRLCGSGT